MEAEPASARQQPVGQVAALCDSATARLERGDIEGARQLFEEALRLDRKYPRALIGMGRVMLETPMRVAQAIEYLSEATALLPTDPTARYYKALAHLKLAWTDLGRDNAQMARRELRLVLELDPSHPDANYRLGLLLRDIYGDLGDAIDAFRTQIAANPAHDEARLALMQVEMDLGHWQAAIAAGEELLRRNAAILDTYPYLAGAYWRAGWVEEAMSVFERYFAIIPAEDRSLYLDLGLILDSSRIKEYENLDEAGRRTYWNHYWGTRDPVPRTKVNERLLEHFIRIAYARITFGKNIWPWDARGGFYVRYGEPDYRSGRGKPVAWDMVVGDAEWIRRKREFQGEMEISTQITEAVIFDADYWQAPGGVEKHIVVALAESIRAEDPILNLNEVWEAASSLAERRALSLGSSATPERWVYLSRGIDVRFEDFAHSGNYTASGVRSRLMIDQMEELKPTISPEEEKIEVIDPMDSVVTFKGEGGKTIVEYAFALLPDEFGAFRSVTGSYATLDVEVNLYTESWEPVAEASEQARRLRTIPQVQIRGIPLFVDATRMEVEPGTYRLTTMLLDPESGKRATAEEMVELPDYSGEELMVSNILPAAMITEVGPGHEGTFIRGNLEVLPLPGRVLQADQPLFIYYEIYNLTKDEYGGTDYRIDYSVAEAPQERALATRLFQGLASLVGVGRKRAVITSSVPATGISRDVHSHLEIDLSGLPPMTYEITLTVTNNLTGRSASSSLLFRTLPAP